MTIQTGTPVMHSDVYNNRAGYVLDIVAENPNLYIIGGNGMYAAGTQYKVLWLDEEGEPGQISEIPATILARYLECAKGTDLSPVGPQELKDLQTQLDIRQKREAAERNKARKEEQQRREVFYAEAERRMPANAKAVIVANLIEDKSDLMSDYHGSTTVKTVILAWSAHTRRLFPEMRKAAARFSETQHLATADEKAEHRENYSMGAGTYLKDGWRDSSGWEVRKYELYSGVESMPVGEWLEEEAPARAEEPKEAKGNAVSEACSFTIEEHTHTKKGYQMFMAIPSCRVERDDYLALLYRAKSLGGWYSRKWGKTPAGFAFKSEQAAIEFAGAADPEPEGPTPCEKTRVADENPQPASEKLADRLEAMAGKMDNAIADKFADRLTNTPKRRREAACTRLDGEHLERTKQVLLSLAALHRSGNVPEELASIKTKKAVHELTTSKKGRSNCGYYDAPRCMGVPSKDSSEALAIWQLLKPKSHEEEKAEEIRHLQDKVRFANIPGFFPTPEPVIQNMLDHARIDDGHKCLEPEAGAGAIADKLPTGSNCYEVNYSLRQILEAKGHNLIGHDFMAEPVPAIYDRVLMNPPFEKGQDIDHVQKAFNCLAPGGRLVAIMSAGSFFRNDRNATAFRAWFEAQNGYKIDLPANSFKESGTGVSVVMVVIDRQPPEIWQ